MFSLVGSDSERKGLVSGEGGRQDVFELELLLSFWSMSLVSHIEYLIQVRSCVMARWQGGPQIGGFLLVG